MHVAFFNPQGNFDPADSYWTEHPDFGGQLVYVKNVAVALARLGHEVDIVTRQIVDPQWPEFAEPIDHYPEGPVRILRVPCGGEGFLRKEDLWPALVHDWVPNIVDRYAGRLPDAVTSHYADGGLAASLLRRDAGVPFTFTAHSLGAQKLDKLHAGGTSLADLDVHYRFGRRLRAERLAMNHAGVVVTSTEQERREQYGHTAYAGAIDPSDDARFAVIPPGVNLAIFGVEVRSPREDEVAARVDERISRAVAPDRAALPAVVASSRLDPKKNLAGLAQAFANSPDLARRANLVIITGALDDPFTDASGAGPSERAVLAELREIIDRGDLDGKVAAFGLQGQDAIAAAYRHLALRRSAFSLTALYEPFGLAPLEAAAAGLPVVVTRNGGPSESLRDGAGEYGVLVDPTDPDDIARGLLRALGEEWDALANAGRRRVLDRYTWDRTAEGYLAAIERAIADERRDLLRIAPFFVDPNPAKDLTTDELTTLAGLG